MQIKRKRPRNGGRRDDILKAARTLFAKQGYDVVSTRDISNTVGVNIATLYHYFPTKKSIYDEVVSGAVKDTISKLLKASSGSDAPELRLRRFISMLTRIYFGSNLDARIIDREQLEGGGLHPARDAQRTFHSDVQNLVAEIFDHSLLDEEVDRETRFLIGMIYGAVKLRATHEIVCGKTLYAEKSLADQLFDHYLDIVHVKKRARLRKE